MTDATIVAEALEIVSKRLCYEDSRIAITYGKMQSLLQEIAMEIKELKSQEMEKEGYK